MSSFLSGFLKMTYLYLLLPDTCPEPQQPGSPSSHPIYDCRTPGLPFSPCYLSSPSHSVVNHSRLQSPLTPLSASGPVWCFCSCLSLHSLLGLLQGLLFLPPFLFKSFYLFISGFTELSLLWGLFSSWGEQGLLSRFGAQVSLGVAPLVEREF